jgi:hypothetical protein
MVNDDDFTKIAEPKSSISPIVKLVISSHRQALVTPSINITYNNDNN